jgi:hypothetical protein
MGREAQMQAVGINEIYQDLRENYLPTVSDFVATLYGRVLAQENSNRILLVSVHQAMWRHAFRHEFEQAAKCRSGLLRLARDCGFSSEHLDRIDAHVLDEFMTIIALRNRRSPIAMVAYNRAVLAIVTGTVGFDTLKQAA